MNVEPFAQQLAAHLRLTRPLVCVDLEATGVWPGQDRIVQIATATIFPDGRVSTWSSLVNPGVAFDEFNIALHGIADETVRHAPRLPEVLPDVRRRLEDQIVGCHTMFDRGAFWAACRLHGEPSLDVRWLDTAAVVRKTWTQFSRRGYKLDNITEYLGITFQHHDALEDAHAAAQVLLRAIEETGVSVEEWYVRTAVGLPATSVSRNSSD